MGSSPDDRRRRHRTHRRRRRSAGVRRQDQRCARPRSADGFRDRPGQRLQPDLGVLLAMMLSTGSVIKGAFSLLIIAKSAIGMIQEIPARQTLDKLAIVGRRNRRCAGNPALACWRPARWCSATSSNSGGGWHWCRVRFGLQGDLQCPGRAAAVHARPVEPDDHLDRVGASGSPGRRSSRCCGGWRAPSWGTTPLVEIAGSRKNASSPSR